MINEVLFLNDCEMGRPSRIKTSVDKATHTTVTRKSHSAKLFTNETDSQLDLLPLDLKHVPILIERKARRSSLSLTVKSDARIILKTNILTSQKTLHEFVLSKKDWLEKCLLKLQQKRDREKAYDFFKGDKVLIQGEEFQKIILNYEKNQTLIDPRKKIFFIAQNHITHQELEKLKISPSRLVHPNSEKIYQLALKEFKSQAVALLKQRIEVLTKKTGLKPDRVFYKNLNSRWGSLSSDRNMNLNYRIYGAPVHVMDYLIIHELCHLVHMNHQKSFWKLVEKHDPEFQKAERWLKQNSYRLTTFQKST